MAKSLTETAKAILQGQKVLKEEGIPSVSSSMSDPDRDTRKMTPNMGTLRPRSKAPEGVIVNPGAMTPSAPDNQVQDLGPALVKQGDVPPSAKAAGAVDKDTSGSSQSRKGAVAAEKPKKQAEVMEEDVEISEELEAFIAEMIEQGLSEEEIEQAIEENFEFVTEEKDEDEDEDDKDEKKVDEDVEQIDEVKRSRAAVERRVAAIRQRNAFELGDEESGEKANRAADRVKKNQGEEGMKKLDRVSSKAIFGKSRMEEEVEQMDETYQIDMSEHVDALLAGENLSEEFKAKATTIFEAAVTAKLEEEVVKIQEAYAQTLEEEVSKIKTELTENVDDYLNYVVENWMSENEVAIEAGLRTELTEDFISGLRNLFAENYIDIPEDKISVVEEMGSKVAELETKLNEEIERNVTLKKQINESRQTEIVTALCDGLTSTQAEKLKRLSEGVEYTSEEHFANKIQTLKENYFHNNVTTNNVLDGVDAAQEDGKVLTEELTGPMAAYVRTLGKKLPN